LIRPYRKVGRHPSAPVIGAEDAGSALA